MKHQHNMGHRELKIAAGGLALLALPYAGYVASTWFRYGWTSPALERQRTDPSLLDEFMPRAEVAELHEIRVDAPAATAPRRRWRRLADVSHGNRGGA
jgi:hypothetical protein